MGSRLSDLVRALMGQPTAAAIAEPAPDQAPARRIDPLIWQAIDRLGGTIAEAMAVLPEQPEHPAGYREDALGRLVPEGSIRPADMERDEAVRLLALEAELISAILRAYRRRSLGAIEAMQVRLGEAYGVALGGKRGNVQLSSYDGRYRVSRDMRDIISFGPELQAAKTLIDQCLERWTSDSNPHVRALIDRAFRTDRKGGLRTGPVLELLRLQIEGEPEWDRAMQALRDSIEVAGSAVYVRVYRRTPLSDSYAPVPLDLASAV